VRETAAPDSSQVGSIRYLLITWGHVDEPRLSPAGMLPRDGLDHGWAVRCTDLSRGGVLSRRPLVALGIPAASGRAVQERIEAGSDEGERLVEGLRNRKE
jgi:hypothetical protein